MTLGIDFMEPHLVVLDGGQKNMNIGNDGLILKSNRKEGFGNSQAVFVEDILIPARSDMVAAETLDEDLNSKIGVVEPVPATTNNCILFARTLFYLISAKSTTTN